MRNSVDFIALVIFFSYLVATWLIWGRIKRGNNLSANPRWWEKSLLWRISESYCFHCHHAYWAVIPAVARYYFKDIDDLLLMLIAVLIVSDMLFHYTAHKYFGDPQWDIIIFCSGDKKGETLIWK